jgi:hypothetical protein
MIPLSQKFYSAPSYPFSQNRVVLYASLRGQLNLNNQNENVATDKKVGESQFP